MVSNLVVNPYLTLSKVDSIISRRALSGSRSIVDAASELGFEILPVTGSHAERAGGLPPHHNDPFDRLIIAQAHLEGMVLGTQDRRMRPYGVATLGLN